MRRIPPLLMVTVVLITIATKAIIQETYNTEPPFVPNPPKTWASPITHPSPTTELYALEQLRFGASYDTREITLLNASLAEFKFISLIKIAAKEYRDTENPDSVLNLMVFSDRAPTIKKREDGSTDFEFYEFRLHFIFSSNFTSTSTPQHYAYKKKDALQVSKTGLMYSSTVRISDISLLQKYLLY